MTNTERIQANNAELREAIELAENLPDAGGGGVAEPVIEPLAITENGTYTAPNGVDGYSPVTVNVPIPDGYIKPSGSLEVTENGTHDVTAYASVNVNVPTGGGDELTELLTNKMTALNSDVTSIRQFAFRGATALVSINLPNATSINTNAFYGCTKLTSVNMPKVTKTSDNVFNGCSILPSIVLPSLTTGGGYMFRYCYKLLTIDLPVITNIVANMFTDCRILTALILRSPTMCTLANTSAFSNCYHFHGTTNSQYNPNGLKDGYIYCPSALIDSYKTATNWSTFASQFRAIEDYPEICGG